MTCSGGRSPDNCLATSTSVGPTPTTVRPSRSPVSIRLGSIDTGLDAIAAAGEDLPMTIEPLD